MGEVQVRSETVGMPPAEPGEVVRDLEALVALEGGKERRAADHAEADHLDAGGRRVGRARAILVAELEAGLVQAPARKHRRELGHGRMGHVLLEGAGFDRLVGDLGAEPVLPDVAAPVVADRQVVRVVQAPVDPGERRPDVVRLEEASLLPLEAGDARRIAGELDRERQVLDLLVVDRQEMDLVLPDRAAQAGAELVLGEIRGRASEGVLGRQALVLEVPEGAAVKLVGPAPGHRVHDPAAGASELGAVAGVRDLELLDRLLADRVDDGRALAPANAAEERVVVGSAVHDVGRVDPALAADHRPPEERWAVSPE